MVVAALKKIVPRRVILSYLKVFPPLDSHFLSLWRCERECGF